MPQSQKMVLDSNVFIEAKNRYYAFDICPGYWDFVIRDFGAENAMSITHVWDEIQVGGDDLATWMEANLDKKQFFDCAKDADVVAQFRAVSSYVTTAYSTKPNAIHDFLEPTVADPWLAAYALARAELSSRRRPSSSPRGRSRSWTSAITSESVT